VVYKYAKYKLVCWRSHCVNEEVRTLTTKRLDGGSKHADREGKSVEAKAQKTPGESPSACVACSCPLWLRRDEDDCMVQLSGCGCVLHASCLMDAALQQHGMTIPSISDPFHVVTLLRRFFGVDAIEVDSVRCPGCGVTSESWRKVPEDAKKVAGVASRRATARALRRGDALRLDGLRSALQALPERRSPSDLDRWRAAAKSEKSFCALLREEGTDSSQRQLAELLLAAARKDGEAAGDAPEASSAESDDGTASTASLESSAKPCGEHGLRPSCRVHVAFSPASAEHPCGVATVEELEARLKTYSDFLHVA